MTRNIDENDYGISGERVANIGFYEYFGVENALKWQRCFGENSYRKYWDASPVDKAAMKREAGIVEAEKPPEKDVKAMIELSRLDGSGIAVTGLERHQQAYRDVFAYETFNRSDLREDLFWIEQQRYMKEVEFVNENHDDIFPDRDEEDFEIDTGTEMNFQYLIEARLGYDKRPILFDQMKPEAQERYIKEWQHALEKLQDKERLTEGEWGDQRASGNRAEAETESETGDASETKMDGVLKQLVSIHPLLKERFSPSVVSNYDRLLESVSEEIEKRGYRVERLSDLDEYNDFRKYVRKGDIHSRAIGESDSRTRVNSDAKNYSGSMQQLDRLIFGDRASDASGLNRSHENPESMIEQFNRVFGLDGDAPERNQYGGDLYGQQQGGECGSGGLRAVDPRGTDGREWDEREWDDRGGDGRGR